MPLHTALILSSLAFTTTVSILFIVYVKEKSVRVFIASYVLLLIALFVAIAEPPYTPVENSAPIWLFIISIVAAGASLLYRIRSRKGQH